MDPTLSATLQPALSFGYLPPVADPTWLGRTVEIACSARDFIFEMIWLCVRRILTCLGFCFNNSSVRHISVMTTEHFQGGSFNWSKNDVRKGIKIETFTCGQDHYRSMIELAVKRSLDAGFDGRVIIKPGIQQKKCFIEMGFIPSAPSYFQVVPQGATNGIHLNGGDDEEESRGNQSCTSVRRRLFSLPPPTEEELYLDAAAAAIWKQIIAADLSVKEELYGRLKAAPTSRRSEEPPPGIEQIVADALNKPPGSLVIVDARRFAAVTLPYEIDEERQYLVINQLKSDPHLRDQIKAGFRACQERGETWRLKVDVLPQQVVEIQQMGFAIDEPVWENHGKTRYVLSPEAVLNWKIIVSNHSAKAKKRATTRLGMSPEKQTGSPPKTTSPMASEMPMVISFKLAKPKTDVSVEEICSDGDREVGRFILEINQSKKVIKIITLTTVNPKYYPELIQRIVHRSFNEKLGGEVIYDIPDGQEAPLQLLGFIPAMGDLNELDKLDDSKMDQLFTEQIKKLASQDKMSFQMAPNVIPIWKKILNAKDPGVRKALFAQLETMQKFLEGMSGQLMSNGVDQLPFDPQILNLLKGLNGSQTSTS